MDQGRVWVRVEVRIRVRVKIRIRVRVRVRIRFGVRARVGDIAARRYNDTLSVIEVVSMSI